MGMNLEVLSPGVQESKETDLGPQMLGVSRNRLQGFCRGLEEDAVDNFLILVSDRGDLCRHGKDHMKIGDCQKFGLPVLDPLRPRQTLAFGAVSFQGFPFAKTIRRRFLATMSPSDSRPEPFPRLCIPSGR